MSVAVRRALHPRPGAALEWWAVVYRGEDGARMNLALRKTSLALGLLIAAVGCTRGRASVAASGQPAGPRKNGDAAETETGGNASHESVGFDRNDYPGDETMAAMHQSFAFTGYWLTNPPGETANTWVGKRALLRAQGWGFLVLANGRLDHEILKAAKRGTTAAALGQGDAAMAMQRAQAEGFPAQTTLFLDQEEGGRLLPEQAAYLLGWTEAVAAGGFHPGVYASGQRVEDSPGVTIDTVEDIRTRVAQAKLHKVAIFDANDACPPAPGCTVAPKPIGLAGEPDVVAWQYAQSPRRPEITKSCAATYAADGNCYAPGFPQVFLDRNVARSADPSGGR